MREAGAAPEFVVSAAEDHGGFAFGAILGAVVERLLEFGVKLGPGIANGQAGESLGEVGNAANRQCEQYNSDDYKFRNGFKQIGEFVLASAGHGRRLSNHDNGPRRLLGSELGRGLEG